VHQISSVQNKPVIGVGGIENGKDAIKFIMAGASAVQVCSAAIREGHEIYGKIAREMAEWLDSHNYKSLAEIKGLYNKKLLERKPFSKNPKMTVAPDKCVMCGACLSKCIQSALYMGEKHTEVTIETCIGCGFCSDFCPKGALELKERNGI
jgi:NAD-dependent dihydropyrimidine dehydrogenase PreA subunit